MVTIWDHTYCCSNKYHFVSAVYRPYCLDLEYGIFIDRFVDAPSKCNDLFGGLNVRDNRLLKFSMSKLLNPESIFDDRNFPSLWMLTYSKNKKLWFWKNNLSVYYLYFILEILKTTKVKTYKFFSLKIITFKKRNMCNIKILIFIGII